MQDNTITLNVDVANDGNAVASVFDRHEEYLNRSVYINKLGGHSNVSRDQLGFYRTPAKLSGESRGSAKCAIKFTRDVSVPNASGTGNITLPLIAEVSFNLPVGITPDQETEVRQRLVAILDDDAVSGGLMQYAEI